MALPEPAVLTLGELRKVTETVNRMAARVFAGPIDESIEVGLSVTEHWIVFTFHQRTFGFWRATMRLFEQDDSGAMGDEEVTL